MTITKGHGLALKLMRYGNLDKNTGCAVEAPAACSLFAKLNNTGLRPIRAGYSALEPNAWIRPHFGMTNMQLKFHLGLIVPTTSAMKQCAFFKVGNSTKGWEEGKILFFDDSFEHEVFACTQLTLFLINSVI
eukprot:m.258344 g.258344  ORF g.258344 m.258344 type:complete len:132 (+) comp16192_c0_seq44:1336-1731(+)